MSIRFKFRSSLNFDSVDIGGRPSISVRDLRSKIVCQKKLNICQDFDLVFSDALTGREYYDENFQIPSGSNVIIKRIPAGSVPSALTPSKPAEDFGMKDSKPTNPIGYVPVNAELDNFDDFGADLCPVLEPALSDSDLEFDTENCFNNEKPNNEGPRAGCQKLEASDISEAIPRGPNHNGLERDTPQTIEEQICAEHMKSEKMVDANCLPMRDVDFPSELKCSLCKTYFKEAVMIPCCQHSFCQKCIRGVLQEKAKCPKCDSCKCKVGDLLPNLSLRQAIERFLESQILMSVADDALNKYAPDGESGIHGKDFSCAVNILQREVNMPSSSFAAERGSNQIMTESACASQMRNTIALGHHGSHTSKFGARNALKSAPSPQKLIDGERVLDANHVNFRNGAQNLEAVPDFQGENQPHDMARNVHEEVDSTVNRNRGMWLNTGGGDRNFMATGRYKKGDRSCYMCGSPDHFIRHCPAASSPHPVLQTGNSMFPGAVSGYLSPFWNSSSTPFPPARPFSSMYGNPGMMPFNSAMVPASTFAVPPYVPSMYGAFPVPSEFMRMGGMVPQVRNGFGRPLTHSENLKLQNCENGLRFSNENLGRGQSSDGEDAYNKRHHCHDPERSHEHKSRIEREKGASYSGDSFTHRSQIKHRSDKHLDHENYAVDRRHEKNPRSGIAERDRSDRRAYHIERSNSGVEDCSDRRSEERCKHHCKSSKSLERKKQCGSDSNSSHHETKREKDFGRKKAESDNDRTNRRRHSHSESGLEPSSSIDQEKQHKQKDGSHVPRHSRHSRKPVSDDFRIDRWQMASGSDEDNGEGYRYHKRKRVH